jgi:FtsP/CotA-like multicopper oxidase with cupredoxin domain
MKSRSPLGPIAVLICLLTILYAPAISAENDPPVRLYVREVPIKIFGKEGKVIAIGQESGTIGLSIKASDGFNVEVVNQLKEPTSIHWHGIVLSALEDGVPFVSQNPIPPGLSFHYQFPLKQSGTYWMHSHYGLQEQLLASAPLILESEEQEAKADEQYVVILSDYSFKSPGKILEQLKGGMKEMAGTKKMSGMGKMPASQKLVAQKWLDESHGFGSAVIEGKLPDTDIKYDALIANRRTLDDPVIFRVKPGHTVLLRIIAGSAATNFLVDTEALTSQLTATDGKDIDPVRGNFFRRSRHPVLATGEIPQRTERREHEVARAI